MIIQKPLYVWVLYYMIFIYLPAEGFQLSSLNDKQILLQTKIMLAQFDLR